LQKQVRLDRRFDQCCRFVQRKFGTDLGAAARQWRRDRKAPILRRNKTAERKAEEADFTDSLNFYLGGCTLDSKGTTAATAAGTAAARAARTSVEQHLRQLLRPFLSPVSLLPLSDQRKQITARGPLGRETRRYLHKGETYSAGGSSQEIDFSLHEK